MFHKNVVSQRTSKLPVDQPSTPNQNSAGLSLVSERATASRGPATLHSASLHQAAPGTSSLHQAAPGTSSMHQAAPGMSSLHQAAPGTSSLHQAAPHSVSLHQAAPGTSSLLELAVIVSRRCSSFFAEAAVLVLVFGILDYFMLKGRIELPWILGALAISAGLLAASIAMDFSAQRWIGARGGSARGLIGVHP